MYHLQRATSLLQRKHRQGRLQQHTICKDALCQTTQKYRNKLEEYLDCIGKDWDMELRMNHRGVCSFQRGRFVIVMEVPKESESFFVYTCLLKCSSTCLPIMRKALELNYLTQETSGCTLALDPTCEDEEELEVTLCYSHPIMALDRGELCNIVLNFMDTASKLHRELVYTEKAARFAMNRVSFSKQMSMTSSPRTPCWCPAPAPESYADAKTPIISNKALRPSKLVSASRNPIKTPDRSKNQMKSTPSLKTFTKMSMAVGLAAVSTSTIDEEEGDSKKRSKVITRLNRMASKKLSRPERPLRRQHSTAIVLKN